jgi:pimeloyl-ACP methyl ester carboxylesterase
MFEFEEGPCPFQVPSGASRELQCGFVTVPEDHGNPAGPRIRLAVVVIRNPSSTRPPDPVLLLAGGPGEKVVASALPLAVGFASLYGERDFIVFDQRGAGLSEPALDCPEFAQMRFETLEEPDPEAVLKAAFNSLMACRDRLVQQGINLSAYNTAQNAADVNAIRIALGYEEINLFGGSYGTLLAQAVMRDHPQGIRSVAMASVLPLEKSFIIDTSTVSSMAILRLADACAADKDCSAAYPSLKEVLFETIERLNANPVPVILTNPLDGKDHQALLTGDAVIGNLTLLLYQTEVIPAMPRATYDVYNGNYSLMTQLLSRNLAFYDASSLGMQYSVLCADDLIGRTQQEYLANRASVPSQLRGRISPEVATKYGALGICRNWQVKQADPSVKLPLVSDVPTLVLTGEFDPVTPPEYGQLVASKLRNGYYFNLSGAGHNVIAASECARQVAGAFFNDPTHVPEAACIASMPGVVFDLPARTTELALKPYSEPRSGFSGLIPEGWKEPSPATWMRGNSALDPAVFIQDAQPGTAAALFDSLMAQLKLDPRPKPINRAQAGNFTWDFYTFDRRGNPVDLALAEDGKKAYFVLLMSPRDEHDALYQQMFMPAVTAMASLE